MGSRWLSTDLRPRYAPPAYGSSGQCHQPVESHLELMTIPESHQAVIKQIKEEGIHLHAHKASGTKHFRWMLVALESPKTKMLCGTERCFRMMLGKNLRVRVKHPRRNGEG